VEPGVDAAVSEDVAACDDDGDFGAGFVIVVIFSADGTVIVKFLREVSLVTV